RCRGTVGIDVIDPPIAALPAEAFQRQPHGANGTFTRGRNHVGPVAGSAVADKLAVDPGAAGARMLELLEHDDAAPTGDDEAVAVAIISTTRALWRVVEFRRHRRHGVEQDRQAPVELLATSREHDIS